MTRSVDRWIVDILEAADRCRRHVALVADAESADLIDMGEDAIERNLQTIGEAVTHLPEAVTAAHPENPWPQIRGFRNVLVRECFGVDVNVVREVVDTHLPALVDALGRHPGGEATV